MFQFKLKTFLALISILAIVFAVYPRIRRHAEWREAHAGVTNWAAALQREKGKTESFCYTKATVGLAGAKTGQVAHFAVYTTEPTKSVSPDGRLGWVVNGDDLPDPNRFFVVPPGKWVDTIDAVIENWDRFKSDVIMR